MTCGDPGSVPGECWNGSPYQPVPVATDVHQKRRAADPRAARGLPRGGRRAAERARLPLAVRREPRARARLPEPDHRVGVRPGPQGPATSRSTAPPRSAGPGSRRSTTAGCAGCRATRASPSTRWAGCSATTSEVAGQPGDTLVTSIDAKVQSVVEKQLAQTITTARQTFDEVSGRNYAADSGAAIVMEADTGRIVAMASQPTYDPNDWVGGISSKQLARLYSDAAGTPLLGRATQGQFAPGSTWKPFMTAGALTHGFSPTPGSTARRRSGSATATSRTTSPAPTATSASTRRSRSPATPSSTGSATTSGSATAATSPTSTPRTRS